MGAGLCINLKAICCRRRHERVLKAAALIYYCHKMAMHQAVHLGGQLARPLDDEGGAGWADCLLIVLQVESLSEDHPDKTPFAGG